MKKISLYISLLTLTFSVDVCGMGLGEMTVSSYLDQPFNAEIELIDVGDTPLSGIKASIATPEEYERMGLDRSYAVGLLTFFIEKNEHGHPVVKIRSALRITEPFMQILLDLAWAQGQVYRSYTILLDPPHYKINIAQKQLHNLVKRQFKGEVTSHKTPNEEENVQQVMPEQQSARNYGPTVANETIWQIAQRFKSDNVSLQQMILAILGTNPDAFVEGNLNGLKVGSQLQIPSNYTASHIPLALAKAEVLAHDKAWQSRQPIEHVLNPPYINAHPASGSMIETVLPKIPQLINAEPSAAMNESRLIPLSSSLLKVNEDVTPTSGTAIPKISGSPPVKAIAVAAAAIDSVREANTMLIEQIHVLQKENKRLQQQLIQRNQDMQQLRKRMNQILLRKGLAGQVSQEMYGEENSSIMPWLILFIILGLSGTVAYWWYWIRPKAEEHPVSEEHLEDEELEHEVDQSIPPEPVVEEKPHEIETPQETVIEEVPHEIEVAPQEPVIEETPHEIEMPPQESLIEEEPLVEKQPIVKKKKPKSTKTKRSSAKAKDEHTIEFEFEPVSSEEKPTTSEKEITEPPDDEHNIEFNIDEESSNPTKSTVALETLLDLAKTYIGMDDFEAAKQSLQEVREYGNKEQKKEAKRLLDEINHKT